MLYKTFSFEFYKHSCHVKVINLISIVRICTRCESRTMPKWKWTNINLEIDIKYHSFSYKFRVYPFFYAKQIRVYSLIYQYVCSGPFVTFIFIVLCWCVMPRAYKSHYLSKNLGKTKLSYGLWTWTPLAPSPSKRRQEDHFKWYGTILTNSSLRF